VSSSSQERVASTAAFALPPALRRGWLRHGNRPGDYAKAARCGARTRAGGCCRQPAMRNGRCRMHGGLSTGPRTAGGLERSRRARWKHGFCSAEIRTLRRNAAQTCRNLAAVVRLARSLERRPASSLGMGFIERNRPAAGSSSGALAGYRAAPPPSRCASHLPRFAEEACRYNRQAPGQLSSSSAKRGRVGRGHGADPWGGYSRGFTDMLFNTSSLGMGFIERNRPTAGRSSGTTPSPAPVRGSG
jgi:hypothetical protein